MNDVVSLNILREEVNRWLAKGLSINVWVLPNGGVTVYMPLQTVIVKENYVFMCEKKVKSDAFGMRLPHIGLYIRPVDVFEIHRAERGSGFDITFNDTKIKIEAKYKAGA